MSSNVASENKGCKSQAQKSQKTQKGRNPHQGQTTCPQIKIYKKFQGMVCNTLGSAVWFRNGNVHFKVDGSERVMDLVGFVAYMATHHQVFLMVFDDHMDTMYLISQYFPKGGFRKFIAEIAESTGKQGKKWTPEGWVDWPASTHAAAAAVVRDDDGWQTVPHTQRKQRTHTQRTQDKRDVWLEDECSNKDNCVGCCGHNHHCLGTANFVDGKYRGHSVHPTYEHTKLCPNDRPLEGKRCLDTRCLLDHCKGRWVWMNPGPQHHAVKPTAPPAPQQVLSVVPKEEFPTLPESVRKLLKPYSGSSVWKPLPQPEGTRGVPVPVSETAVEEMTVRFGALAIPADCVRPQAPPRKLITKEDVKTATERFKTMTLEDAKAHVTELNRHLMECAEADPEWKHASRLKAIAGKGLEILGQLDALATAPLPTPTKQEYREAVETAAYVRGLSKHDDAADTLDEVFGSQDEATEAAPPRHTPAISFHGRTPEERAEAESLVENLFGDSTLRSASSTSPPLPAKAKVVTTVAEESQAVLQAAREKKKGKKKGKKSPGQGHSLSDRL